MLFVRRLSTLYFSSHDEREGLRHTLCPVTGLLDPLCLLALLGDAASSSAISIELALERHGPKSALDPVS